MTGTSPPERPAERSGSNALALGAILIVAGLLLFAGQLADIDIGDLGWPVIVIGVGVVLFVLGLVVNREQGMVIGGTVVTVVGLVLFYQNQTGHWESWAYAWALVGPAASGLGLALWGARTGNTGDLRNGTWGLLGGLGLFAVGYLFFEGVIGISGQRLPIAEWVLPAVVIGIGVIVLGRGLFSRGEQTEA
jgi:dipeptide/tripeptide permease